MLQKKLPKPSLDGVAYTGMRLEETKKAENSTFIPFLHEIHKKGKTISAFLIKRRKFKEVRKKAENFHFQKIKEIVEIRQKVEESHNLIKNLSREKIQNDITFCL